MLQDIGRIRRSGRERRRTKEAKRTREAVERLANRAEGQARQRLSDELTAAKGAYGTGYDAGKAAGYKVGFDDGYQAGYRQADADRDRA